MHAATAIILKVLLVVNYAQALYLNILFQNIFSRNAETKIAPAMENTAPLKKALNIKRGTNRFFTLFPQHSFGLWIGFVGL